jgi:hypothetical protein
LTTVFTKAQCSAVIGPLCRLSKQCMVGKRTQEVADPNRRDIERGGGRQDRQTTNPGAVEGRQVSKYIRPFSMLDDNRQPF